ncbi:DUF397 domain-containing protein [Nocardiopsis aegyptia]|uniref:DUF397 domain-containing protein n=1 Tax=Nocardiopsis aegyptia TaxID=220378 RepID=UPI00366EA88B
MGNGPGVTGPWWRKSSYSSHVSNCVEVAETGGLLFVRDSRHTDLGFLGFAQDEWRSFLLTVSGG